MAQLQEEAALQRSLLRRSAGARSEGSARGGLARPSRASRSDTVPARAERQRAPNHDDGSANLAAGLAEMGLSPNAAWYSSVVLYGVGGLVVTGLYTVNPNLFPRGVFYLGYCALLIAALQLLAMRLVHNSESFMGRATHARLIAGLAIFLAGAIILDGKLVGFALLPLLIIPTACYLFTWRMATPYVFAATAIVAVSLLVTPGPARLAHTLITSCAFVLIAASIIITKQRSRRLASRNRQLAYTDFLTGIANMRRLRERISAGPGRSSADRQPFALFAIDLDDFKQVNDRFDHSLGDEVLCAVAEAIRDTLQPGDLAVRRGGDEFSVLVPDPAERDLEGLREALEYAIGQARLATCPQVTPSGTVTYIRTRPGEEIGPMMERADQALHEAKIDSRRRRHAVACAEAEAPQAVGIPNDLAYTVEPAESAGPQQQSQTDSEQTERSPYARLLKVVGHAVTEGDPDWRFAALLLNLGAVVIGLVSLAGWVAPLVPVYGALVAACAGALGIGCLWAGTRGISHGALHLPWLLAYGLLAIEIALAGPSGAALLDLIPAIGMYGFLVFKARTAALYLVLGQGMYAAFAIGGHFTEGVMRTVVSTAVVAVIGGLIAKLRLVTIQFARTNRELSELDALTGVGNVRALRGRVADVIDRAGTQELRPVLVTIDLDEFKQVNDVHSHSTGDRVLIAVSRAVSERVRIDELVARRGGDEFVVVLRDADPSYTEEVVRRIDDAIVRARSRICPDLRPTASVTAVPWQPGETPDELLHDADVALHVEKARSRPISRLAATA